VRSKEPYLLWVGRMTPEKGPQRAIIAARLAGMRLVLAGPVQPGQEAFFEREVAPHVDGERVVYAGEIADEAKRRLFSRAWALLMPIRWPEPFGMVMLEAMVCGTPVIAFPEGAARELVTPGRTGYLVKDEQEMARVCARANEIDPVVCRATVVDRCDARCVARSYEDIYRRVAEATPRSRAVRRMTAGRLRTTAPAVPGARVHLRVAGEG
jgi:glycosyltransferase involved in cell wall biosynthesis